MGQISSINFKKSNAIQTRHNDRDLAPNYLLKSGGIGVECNRNHKEALELRNKFISDAMLKYQEVVKQPFKAKSYEWSAVCNIKETTTMQDLENLAKHFQDKYGFQCYQIAIHRDEGHIDEQGKPQINHHAHLEFITLDKNTGKSLFRAELQRPKALRQMQTEVAQILGMQRGVDKRISKVKRIEPRAYAQMKEQERQRIKELKELAQDENFKKQEELQAEKKHAIELLMRNEILEQENKTLKETLKDELEKKKEALKLAEQTRQEMIGQGFAKEDFRELSGIKKKLKDAEYNDIDEVFSELDKFRKKIFELGETLERAVKQIDEREKRYSALIEKISILWQNRQTDQAHEFFLELMQSDEKLKLQIRSRDFLENAPESKINAFNQKPIQEQPQTIKNDFRGNSDSNTTIFKKRR